MDTETEIRVSDVSHAYEDYLGHIHGRCDVCSRGNVRLIKYAFGEQERTVDFTDINNPVKDNPRAFKIVICATDTGLIRRVRKDAPGNWSSRQIWELAKEYRRTNPINSL